MSGGQKAKTVLVTALLGLLLSASLALILFFGYSYLSANWRVFPALSLLKFSSGWGRLWLCLWLGSDVLFFILVALILVEIILFLIRTILRTGIRAHGLLANRDVSGWNAALKQWSLLTLFRAIGVNDRKKAVIAYVIIILVVFGPGWLGKAVLQATDDLVFRTREQQHLQEETHTVDFAQAISAQKTYDLSITAGVGIIHLYTSKDTPEGRFHFLYDNDSQKNAFTMAVDEEAGTIMIAFGAEETYEAYVDPVPSAVEIFLPASLPIDSVTVNIAVSGFLAVSYLDFSTFQVDLKNTQTAFSTEGFEVGSIRMKTENGSLTLKTGTAALLDLDLSGTKTSVETGTILGTVNITAVDTDLQWFRTHASALVLRGSNSELELREIYASDVDMEVDRCRMIYRNNDDDYDFTLFELRATASTVSSTGVPYDPQGND